MKESQLENKTEIATNDYVRMVDENNNSVKIKKDSFMAAIRDALPSTISDGATGGGSVLSIINGALKTRTDANLASVLGGVSWKNISLSGFGSEGKLFTPTNACIFVLLYDSRNRCGMYSYDKDSGTIKTILAAPRVVVGTHSDNNDYYMWVSNGDIYISNAAESMSFNYLVLGG